jgi:hypothetical protein
LNGVYNLADMPFLYPPDILDPGDSLDHFLQRGIAIAIGRLPRYLPPHDIDLAQLRGSSHILASAILIVLLPMPLNAGGIGPRFELIDKSSGLHHTQMHTRPDAEPLL